MSWNDVGYVYASKYRKKVLESLSIRPKTPSTIAKEANIRITHVSRALNQLVNKGLVECLTPERFRGKIYRLTPKGHEVYKKIYLENNKLSYWIFTLLYYIISLRIFFNYNNRIRGI